MKVYHLKCETHNCFVSQVLETDKFYLVPDKDGHSFDFFRKSVYELTILDAHEPECDKIGFENIP